MNDKSSGRPPFPPPIHFIKFDVAADPWGKRMMRSIVERYTALALSFMFKAIDMDPTLKGTEFIVARVTVPLPGDNTLTVEPVFVYRTPADEWYFPNVGPNAALIEALENSDIRATMDLTVETAPDYIANPLVMLAILELAPEEDAPHFQLSQRKLLERLDAIGLPLTDRTLRNYHGAGLLSAFHEDPPTNSWYPEDAALRVHAIHYLKDIVGWEIARIRGMITPRWVPCQVH